MSLIVWFLVILAIYISVGTIQYYHLSYSHNTFIISEYIAHATLWPLFWFMAIMIILGGTEREFVGFMERNKDLMVRTYVALLLSCIILAIIILFMR